MLNKETLLDLIRHFIVFEKSKRKILKQESSPSQLLKNWQLIINIML